MGRDLGLQRITFPIVFRKTPTNPANPPIYMLLIIAVVTAARRAPAGWHGAAGSNAAADPPTWPPTGHGTCNTPKLCDGCFNSSCATELSNCNGDKVCAAAQRCISSTVAANHVAGTPTNCQSMDCIIPCFPLLGGQPSPASNALAICIATCLPESESLPAAPQQVHIAFAGGGPSGMAVSWTTASFSTASLVQYGTKGTAALTAAGTTTNYTFQGGSVKDTWSGGV